MCSFHCLSHVKLHLSRQHNTGGTNVMLRTWTLVTDTFKINVCIYLNWILKKSHLKELVKLKHMMWLSSGLTAAWTLNKTTSTNSTETPASSEEAVKGELFHLSLIDWISL